MADEPNPLEIALEVPNPEATPIPPPGEPPAPPPAPAEDPPVAPHEDGTAPPEAPIVADEPEGLAMLASGRLRVQFDGKTFTLRRPKFDEVLTYIDKLEEADEKVQAATQANPLKSLRSRADAQNAVATWLFTTFADNRLPDDHPAWLASIDFLQYVRNHWQSVPLLPGNA